MCGARSSGGCAVSTAGSRGRNYAAASAEAAGGQPAKTGNCSTRQRCAPRATATGARLSRHRGRPRDEDTLTRRWDLWSARCSERGTPGAGSGSGKRPRREAGTAPRADFTVWDCPMTASTFSVLSEFRARIVAHSLEARVLDLLVARLVDL